jgi:hypothetical protein
VAARIKAPEIIAPSRAHWRGRERHRGRGIVRRVLQSAQPKNNGRAGSVPSTWQETRTAARRNTAHTRQKRSTSREACMPVREVARRAANQGSH